MAKKKKETTVTPEQIEAVGALHALRLTTDKRMTATIKDLGGRVTEITKNGPLKQVVLLERKAKGHTVMQAAANWCNAVRRDAG